MATKKRPTLHEEERRRKPGRVCNVAISKFAAPFSDFCFRGRLGGLDSAVSYQVFARKYRPQTFDDLVGQAHVTRTLKNAVEQNRLAHAYLFVGPRGIGKTSTARILAKALNCVNGPTIAPCGVCDSCKEITAGNSLDVLEIDGASNNGVEQVRELRDNVRYAPSKGHFKIYIIDEVHMLTSAAFNALLKTLEEPPPHVKFIFATTEPQKVLPTILSRCQRFDLHRIPANLIAQHLQFIAGKEKITLDPAAAHAIAKGADGGLRDAESMLDQLVAFCGEKIAEPDVLSVFGFTSEQTVANFTEKILRGLTSDALELLHAEAENGKDMMKLMSDLIAYLRDVLVGKVKPDALADDVNPELQKSLEAQAALIDTDRLLELIDQFAAAEGRMKWAPNKRLHFEVAVIKAIQTLGQVTLNEVIENLSALRDGKAPAASARRVAQSNPKPPEKFVAAAPAPRVAEKTPVKETQTPPKPDPIPASEPTTVDYEAVWQKAVAETRSRRRLIGGWVEMAHALGTEGRFFVIGFAPEQKMAMESLSIPRTRDFLEALIKEISGQDWKIKFVLKEGLPVAAAADFAAAAQVPVAKKKDDSQATFKDDPLIREALEIFKGEIKTVTD
ncbi:MAG: DNA polymerase III subunit gamma/tau [Verrucomicrobiota bacterium]|nr:DNA polymerase III subunit gamma/tau [Verrucomicrobiota bacterium]